MSSLGFDKYTVLPTDDILPSSISDHILINKKGRGVLSISTNLSIILNALLLASLLAASHGLLKWAAQQQSNSSFNLLSKRSLGVGASLGIYCLVIFLYIHVLRSQDITKIYPAYTGLSILLVLLIGVLFFNEKLARLKIIGCLMIIVGVCLIGKQ